MFVIDTNVASELMRPEPASAVVAWIAGRDAQGMYLTAVNEAELRYGVAIMPVGKRRNALEAAMTRWFDQGFRARILPFDSVAARAYAEIAADRRQARRTVRSRRYADPGAQFWSPATCGISTVRESTLSTPGRLRRSNESYRFVFTHLMNTN